MKVVCFPVLILLTSLQLQTSVISFFKRSLPSRDVWKLLGAGSSSGSSEKGKSFRMDKLPDLPSHEQGQSWLHTQLVNGNTMSNEEVSRGITWSSHYLNRWSSQWAWQTKPYELSQIPFMNKLKDAYVKPLANPLTQQEKESLEKAIDMAEKEILKIKPTKPKAIDIHTEFLGVLAAITGATRSGYDLTPADAASREYLSQKGTLDRISTHVADETDLLTLVHGLCDCLRPT